MKYRFDLGSFTLDLAGLAKFPEGSFERELDERTGALESAHHALHGRFHSKQIGFYDWPLQAPEEEIAAQAALAKKLRDEFEGALVFGIGGSYLGAACVQQALRSPEEEEAFPVRWVSNVDPGAISDAVHFARKRRCAAVVISKSGNTIETLSGFFRLSRELDPKGYVVITDPSVGELRRLATEQGWPSFPVPPNVGGRFSVLTAVGLFPAFLMGLPADELLAGARDLRARLDEEPPAVNPAYLFAYLKWAWDTRFRRNVQYLMPYRQALEKLGDWYVQLWGESIGKKQRVNRDRAVGFTPVAALGTADQHSLLQLFKEGPHDKIIGFVDVPGSQTKTPIGEPRFPVRDNRYLFPHSFEEITHKASLAVEKSLVNSGVPTYRIELPRLDARALGALFFFMETACGLAGELYEVDAFDQPGVEEAKRILRESL